MKFKQRAGARMAATLPALAASLAMALAPAFAPEAHAAGAGIQSRGASAQNGGAADTSAMVAATVNGQVITRGQVIDALLADQASNLNALDPVFKGKQRATAQWVGALVVKKMAANGYKPVTVSRAELVNWAFQDKPEILIATVERMIQSTAVAQAAKKEGIVLTAAELAQQTHESIQNAAKTYKYAGMTDDEILKQMGFRRDYLKPFVTTQLYLEKLIAKDTAKKLGHPVTADDYRGASHILIMVHPDAQNPAGNDKLWADAKTKIEGIANEIKSGKKTFEQAAQEYSDDGSKFQQGNLGVFLRGQMVPEFDKTVFSGEKGKVSEPVKTQFGWHLIRVDKLGSETTGPERAKIEQATTQQKMPDMIRRIVSEATVVNRVPRPTQPAGLQLPNQR